jgi:iron(III) transport system permease protein
MTMTALAMTWMRRAGWRGRSQFVMPGIGVTVALFLIVLPLTMLVIVSLRSGTPWSPGPFSLRNYIAAYSDARTYTMLVNSILLAVVATFFSMIIAVFFAFLTERTDMPMRNVAWALMLIPIAMPGVLFAISWIFLLSPRIGLFNVYLRDFLSLFGLEMTQGPFNVYTLGGMIFLESLRGVTTIFLIIVGAFRAMDPTLEEAARISGASNTQTFFRVFLPLITPALLAGGMYNLMTNLESLEIPLVIGMPAGIYVFPSYIYFTTQRYSPPQYGISSALGASFLVLSCLLVWWYRRLIGQASRFATVTGKGYRPRIITLGAWRWPCFAIFGVYFILTILAPMAILLWTSFLPLYLRPSSLVTSMMSMRNYEAIFSEPEYLTATLNTLWVGLGSATLTMVLCLILSWVTIRQRIRGAAVLDSLTFIPNALPGVVIGIAFLFLFLQPPLNSLQMIGTVWIVILALTSNYIAFGSRTMNSALTQIHAEMEEAGKISGAKWRHIMLRIVLPLLMPAFISGWIWVFSHALRNFSIPVLLIDNDSEVLSVVLWEAWDNGQVGRAAALGCLLVAALTIFTLGGRLIVNRLSRQQQG